MTKFGLRVAVVPIPYALLGYGVYGLYYIHALSGTTDSAGWSAFVSTTTAYYGPSRPVLWQAIMIMLLGAGLVTWLRLPGSGPVKAAARKLWRSRTRGILPGQELLVLALAPVTLALTSGWAHPGGIAGLVFLEICALMLAFRSRLWAATLAASGLLVLGGYGLLLALFWPQLPGAWFGVTRLGSHTFAGCTAEGLVMLALGLWLAPRVIGVRTGAHTAALEERAAELTERVGTLTQTRADAVDTAAAELRRIERDLHDGAQARLVALGLSLQAAERVFRRNPDAALALVSEAKDASSKALTELRDLVRGIYPPVLADRGLADAVKALAMDTPLHTVADVDLPGEVDMPVGAAVYFAVAEVLTNAVRHSGARTVRIQVGHRNGVPR